MGVKPMKAKVCGIWASAGVGTSEKTSQQFEWNNIYLCVLYTDRKQVGMVEREGLYDFRTGNTRGRS